MKIDRIRLTHVCIPLVDALRIGKGVIMEKESILVSVSAEGLTGFGEASPMDGAGCCSEMLERTWNDLVQRIIPAIVSMRPRSLDDVCGVLEAIDGDCFARAGLEAAFWDLEAQRAGVPLGRLLGGSRTHVEVGLSLGMAPTIPDLLRNIECRLADGYRRLKLAVQPGWDLEPLREVRRHFGDIPLMVDGNCSYTPEHLDHLRRFDDFGMLMIEQPFGRDDIEGHALLQGSLATPLCLDESAESTCAVQHAIDAGACRAVTITTQRVSGLRNAVRIHDLCAAAGIAVSAGTMPELGVGSVQAVHLATLANFRQPADVQASSGWLTEDLVAPCLEVHDGEIHIPMAAGTAYQVATDAVAKYAVRSEVVI
jgi:o-succinylbenzoate synthase